MSKPSIFTQIINGEIPCHKVYEDEDFIVFLDIHPLHEGHTLLVPKQQIDHIWDLPDDIYENLMKLSRQFANFLQIEIKSKRVGMVVEGFGVPHAHVHLIPIDSPDDLKQQQDMTKEPDHENLGKIAKRIRSRINGQ